MRSLLLASLLIAIILLGAPPLALVPIPVTRAAPLAQDDGPEPLPRGCGSVTPPGEELAACCISGYVYMDGATIGGAEVIVSSPRGDSLALYTRVYSDTANNPLYRLNLSAPPLEARSGEAITITARYSSHERSISYIVQPGSQLVDVVLGRESSADYAFRGRIWGQAETKKLNNPYGITADDQGFIYVADRSNARIQVFRSNGDFVRQWGTLGSQAGQFAFPRGIAVDNRHNVYVGDANNFRIQKFSNSGTYITSWGSRGTGDGQFEDILMLAVDLFESIYVLDGGRIQKFSSTGEHLMTLHVQGTGTDQFQNPPDGMAVDTEGNLYLSGWDGIQGEGRIHKYAPDGHLLARWDRLARFINVVTVDHENYVYFIDMGPREIVKLSPEGARISSWPLQLSAAGFPFPTGITADIQGNVYVVLAGPDIVQRYSANDGFKSAEWGGRGASDGQLVNPTAIVSGPDNGFYIADTGASRIQQFSSDGTWLHSWGSLGSGALQFNGPAGIAMDANSNVFVADTGNHRIRQFTADGQFVDGWGSFGTGNGQFLRPEGIAIDANSILYVADTGNNRVQRRFPDGVWEIWNSGFENFLAPEDIAVDVEGNVYVADTGNQQIQQKFPDGHWRLWNPPPTINPDTYYPVGVAVMQSDRIAVADGGNTLLHIFERDGTWLSSWGAPGSNEGLFQEVNGVESTASGIIAVVDRFDNKISLFGTATYTRPIATITHVSAPSIGPSDTLVIRGMGQDSDETPAIIAYRWRSDKDGELGSESMLTRTAASLSPGSHTITLEVQDSEGEWSDPVATSVYVAVSPQVTWTALLYLAGDFGDRGSQFNAFNAVLADLQTTLRNPAIRVAVQVDGPVDGDSYRVLIIPGDPPQVTRLEHIGEQAMDDPASLAAFMRWGQGSFPATHYYLAIADHGQAIQGIAWDRISDLHDDGTLNDSAYLTPAELGRALRAEGVAPVNIIHLDACSMNLLEVAYELRPLADVPAQSRLLIASQYLGWNYFAYGAYINAIGAGDTPAQVARIVTRGYAERAQADRVPHTIAALDLGRVDSMAKAVDNLGAELAAHVNNDRDHLDEIEAIWRVSPHFESNGDYLNNELDDYVDLPTWVSKVQLGVTNSAVKQRAFELINELTGANPFILLESNRVGHGNLPARFAGGSFIDLSGAGGVSIYYPSQANTIAFDNYINNRLFSFTGATRWADFLIAGIGIEPGPGPRRPLPGPLTGMDPAYRVMLPLLLR